MTGQATTIGTALRRVLLSSLPGVAITGIRIEGICDEFSTIPNIKEGVIDLLLNIKQIVLKGNISEPTSAYLYAKTPGVITAADIELPPNLQVVDPHQYIANFSGINKLKIELLIGRGLKYVENSRLQPYLPAGFISVDAVYHPVKKVNVSTTPIGDLEDLYLDVTTNGSITPEEAITTSAEILENTFAMLKIDEAFTNDPLDNVDQKLDSVDQELESLLNFESLMETPYDDPLDQIVGPASRDIQKEEPQDLKLIPIEKLGVNVQVHNSLKEASIYSLGDLIQYSAKNLRKVKNFGAGTVEEIKCALKKQGLKLKGD
jgi:DNA-directed RNA polymerase subunit alpha